jgi:hypothetical protein
MSLSVRYQCLIPWCKRHRVKGGGWCLIPRPSCAASRPRCAATWGWPRVSCRFRLGTWPPLPTPTVSCAACLPCCVPAPTFPHQPACPARLFLQPKPSAAPNWCWPPPPRMPLATPGCASLETVCSGQRTGCAVVFGRFRSMRTGMSPSPISVRTPPGPPSAPAGCSTRMPSCPAWKNHVVLIGGTALGLRDVVSTPFHPNAPGVSVHAELLAAGQSGERWPGLVPRGAPLLAGIATMLAALLLVPPGAAGAAAGCRAHRRGGHRRRATDSVPACPPGGRSGAARGRAHPGFAGQRPRAHGLADSSASTPSARAVARSAKLFAAHLGAAGRGPGPQWPQPGPTLRRACWPPYASPGCSAGSAGSIPCRAWPLIHALHSTAANTLRTQGGQLEHAQGEVFYISWPDNDAQSVRRALDGLRQLLNTLLPILERNAREDSPLSFYAAFESGVYLLGLVGGNDARRCVLLGPVANDVAGMLTLSEELDSPISHRSPGRAPACYRAA